MLMAQRLRMEAVQSRTSRVIQTSHSVRPSRHVPVTSTLITTTSGQSHLIWGRIAAASYVTKNWTVVIVPLNVCACSTWCVDVYSLILFSLHILLVLLLSLLQATSLMGPVIPSGSLPDVTVLWYWYCIFALVNKILSFSLTQSPRPRHLHLQVTSDNVVNSKPKC